MEHTIRLQKGEYVFDDQKLLGKGGFATVFKGVALSDPNQNVAIKHFNAGYQSGAYREAGIAEELSGRELEHVLPFIDRGEDPTSKTSFVVMPRAEKSLATIHEDGPISSAEAATILLEIVSGLIELSGLVHGDLKPDNVLFHDGKWKVSDLAIGRVSDTRTSRQTLKGLKSLPYAAPEEWRSETAIEATDTYALGCIAFFLVTGSPPFPCHSPDQCSNAHQFLAVPEMKSDNSALVSLVMTMLEKEHTKRPSHAEVYQRLTEVTAKSAIRKQPRAALGTVAKPGASALLSSGRNEAALRVARKTLGDRGEIAGNALLELRENAERLWQKISEAAAGARKRESKDGVEVLLGEGRLRISGLEGPPCRPDALPGSGWDVVAYATVSIQQPSYAWTASLWYAKLPRKRDYRWAEVAFMDLHSRRLMQPFASPPCNDANMAIRGIPHSVQVAFGPVPIDREDEPSFHERCADLLSRAADGNLTKPMLPVEEWPPQFEMQPR